MEKLNYVPSSFYKASSQLLFSYWIRDETWNQHRITASMQHFHCWFLKQGRRNKPQGTASQVDYRCSMVTSHGKIIKAKQTHPQSHLFSIDINSRLDPNLSPTKISGSHLRGKLLLENVYEPGSKQWSQRCATSSCALAREGGKDACEGGTARLATALRISPCTEGTAGVLKGPIQPREARNCSDFHQGCSSLAQRGVPSISTAYLAESKAHQSFPI